MKSERLTGWPRCVQRSQSDPELTPELIAETTLEEWLGELYRGIV